MTEFDAVWFAAVLAANSQFDVRPRFAAEVASNFHQTSNTLSDRSMRMDLNRRCRAPRTREGNCPNRRDSFPSVVCVRSFVPKLKNSASRAIWSATSAARGISIIVPTRYLNFVFFLLRHFVSDATHNVDLQLQLARKSHERNHDFGADLYAFGLHLRGGFKNRAGLHFGNLGKRIPSRQPR